MPTVTNASMSAKDLFCAWKKSKQHVTWCTLLPKDSYFHQHIVYAYSGYKSFINRCGRGLMFELVVSLRRMLLLSHKKPSFINSFTINKKHRYSCRSLHLHSLDFCLVLYRDICIASMWRNAPSYSITAERPTVSPAFTQRGLSISKGFTSL